MTIIEKEIKKREALIVNKTEKEQEANALREQADSLEREAAEIDVVALKEEIAELLEYLPNPPEGLALENAE